MNVRQNLQFLLFFAFCQNIHAQKVILTFDAPLNSTPSVSKAPLRYNKDFAYSFTFDDAENDPFTIAFPLFRGGVVPNSGYTSTGLFYTDGCGNNLPFRAGVAWNTANTIGQDMHTGNVATKMTWAQLDQLYAAGWDVLNHSWSHRARWSGTMTDADYIYEINQNPIDIQNKTANRIKTPHFVVPSGDFIYQDKALAQGVKAVFDQNFPNGGVSFNGIRVDTALNFQNFKAYREELDPIILGNIPNRLDTIANQSRNGVHIWYNEFTHRIDFFNQSQPFNFYKVRDYFQNIANTHGKTGSDRIWMASLPEVFEYLVCRDNLSFTKTVVAGNKLELNFDLSRLPSWLPRRKCISLIINGNVDFSHVQLPYGVTGTWRGTGTTKLLNLEFANYEPPIPIELVSFTGYFKNERNILNWQIGQQGRMVKVEVEKSLDGSNFSKISSQNARGNTANYAFTDSNVQGAAYYRLRLVNVDSSFELSKTIQLNGIQAIRPSVKITPSVSEGFLKIDTNFESRSLLGQAEIFDQSGRLILSQKMVKDKMQIDVDTLPTNIYILRITQGAFFWTHKFAKL